MQSTATNDTLNYENLDMVLPCIEVKRFEIRIFPARGYCKGGCNVMKRHNFLAQKLEAKIVHLVSVHCHAHRFTLASYYTAADLYSMVYETAKAL